MNFNECMKKGMLKEDASAKNRIPSSLDMAKRFLHAAKKNFEIEEYEMVTIAAYNCAFHCARALLFASGYTERNHFCLGIATRKRLCKANRFLGSI